MKKMKITIRKDGTQKIEVLGAVGDECVEFTHEMESRLGKQEGERELKPEYEAAEGEVERDYEAGS
jgi:hypothetical protein